MSLGPHCPSHLSISASSAAAPTCLSVHPLLPLSRLSIPAFSAASPLLVSQCVLCCSFPACVGCCTWLEAGLCGAAGSLCAVFEEAARGRARPHRAPQGRPPLQLRLPDPAGRRPAHGLARPLCQVCIPYSTYMCIYPCIPCTHTCHRGNLVCMSFRAWIARPLCQVCPVNVLGQS